MPAPPAGPTIVVCIAFTVSFPAITWSLRFRPRFQSRRRRPKTFVEAGCTPASIAEIGAATTTGRGTSMHVGDALLTLGGSAIGPAPSNDGHVFVYPTTFHPNTANPLRATVVTVGSGEERSGIDFQLTPVATRRVAGVIVSADGQVGRVAGADHGRRVRRHAARAGGREHGDRSCGRVCVSRRAGRSLFDTRGRRGRGLPVACPEDRR